MTNANWSGQTPQNVTPPASPPQVNQPNLSGGNTLPPQVGQVPYQLPTPPKKNKALIWGIMIGVGALVIFTVGGVVVASSLVSRLSETLKHASEAAKSNASTKLDETTKPNGSKKSGEILPAAAYKIVDRPGWQDMVDTVSGINDKYRAAVKDGSIINMTPVSLADNPDYFKDFLYILWDYNSAIPFMKIIDGTDPEELDISIASLKNKALLAESQFLAGKAFGIPITITREDGSTYESDGSLNNSSDGSSFADDREEFARSFAANPGADGTYIEAAEALAARFGRHISYDFQNIYEHCLKSGDDKAVVAAFCVKDPSTIYVNTAHPKYPAGYSHPSFIDNIKHELSHAVIYDTCGTTRPVIAGQSVEAITQSYAVLFLGADFNVLQTVGQSFPAYMMTEASDAVATSINGGTCR